MNAGKEGAPSNQSWPDKFRSAIKGCVWAFTGQNSFLVHLVMTALVFALAIFLRLEAWRWAVLFLAVGGVLAAEMLNTAVETLVKVLHPEHDRQIGHALDAAAGAVLCAAVISIMVGIVTLGPPIWAAAFAP